MRKFITFSLCFIGAAAMICGCGNRKAQQEAQAFIAAGGMDRPEAGPLRREMERLFHREEGALN